MSKSGKRPFQFGAEDSPATKSKREDRNNELTIVPYYRQPWFYDYSGTKTLPRIKIRKYYDVENEVYMVHWTKENPTWNGKDLPCSHLMVSAPALPQFIEKFELILDEVSKVSSKETLPRFVDNTFADKSDRNEWDFWHPSIVESLDCSDLLLRPVKDYRGQWSIAVLSPVKKSNQEKASEDDNYNWIGSKCSFDIMTSKRFLHILKCIQHQLLDTDETD